ncbi:SNF2 family N-terminal domain-containing protein [Pyronema omphalodes]|nr:SNF2 family N-terminal domain-containing protein [Pyronema omphalodes]
MWKVPQMETALMDHQVLGVDWMLSREKVTDIERDFKGGFVCDAMGMGKTMQSIGTMLLNPPPDGGPRTTLVVAPVALLHQWAEEIDKHITAAHKFKVHVYHGSGKTKIKTVNDLKDIDVLLCSYSAVMASWPKEATEKVKKKMNAEQMDRYEKEHFANRKLLHKTKFWRIILDECHYIKNHTGRTSKGCQNLEAVHKWALSGTPIQNKLWDVFGTLVFLGHPTLSDKDEFQSIAGLDGNNSKDARKMRLMLRNCMMRRKKTDYFMGKRLITLPTKTTRFIKIELNREEQRLYDLVCEYFKELINEALSDISRAGKRKAAMLMLISLTRMRQLVNHPYLIFETLSRLRPGQIKEAIEKPEPAKLRTKDDDWEKELFGSEPDLEPEYQDKVAEKETSAIRRIIKAYGDMPPQETTEAVIICPQCGDTADDPVVVKSCGHIFCLSCLEDALEIENHCPMVNDDGVKCMKSARFSTYQPPPTFKVNWLENPAFAGPFAHSSKTLAFVKQLAEWRISHPDDKVIVFSNFTQMLDILAKILDESEIKYARYDGGMSMIQRAEALDTFRNDFDTKVFLISIKAGGVGLNLTTANLVICFDMWWNAATEHQAFDRVHRLGQQKDVFVSRFIVKGSVEDKMLEIQKRKLDISNTATGDNGYGVGKLTLMDLMSCFGTLVNIGGKDQLV